MAELTQQQEIEQLYNFLQQEIQPAVKTILDFKILGQSLASIAKAKDVWSLDNSVTAQQQQVLDQADSFVFNFSLLTPQLNAVLGLHQQTVEVLEKGGIPSLDLPSQFFTVTLPSALSEVSQIITSLSSNYFINNGQISSDFFDYLVADFGGVLQPFGEGGRKDLNEFFGLLFSLNDPEGPISLYLATSGQRFYNIPDIRPASNTAAKGTAIFFSDIDLERSIFGASAPPAYYIGAVLQPSRSPEGQAQNDPLGVFNKYRRAAPYIPCRHSPYHDEIQSSAVGWDDPNFAHLSDLSVAEKGIVLLSSTLPTGPDPNRPQPTVRKVDASELFEDDGIEFVLGQQVYITEIVESSTGTWVGFIPFPTVGFPELRIRDLTRNYTKVLYTKVEYIRKAEASATIDPDPPIKYMPNSALNNQLFHLNDPDFTALHGGATDDNGFIVDDAITNDWINLKQSNVKIKYFNFDQYNRVEAQALETTVNVSIENIDSDVKKKFSEGYFYFVVGKGQRSPTASLNASGLTSEEKELIASNQLQVAGEEASKNAFNDLLLYLDKDTESTRLNENLRRKYFAPISSLVLPAGPVAGEERTLFAFPASIAEALSDSKKPYDRNFPDGSPFLEGRDYVIPLETKFFQENEEDVNDPPVFIKNIVNIFENKFKTQVQNFQTQGTILDPGGIKYNIDTQIENLKKLHLPLFDFFERQYLGSSAQNDELSKIIANAFKKSPGAQTSFDHKIEIGLKDNGEIGENVRLTISYVLFIPDPKALAAIDSFQTSGGSNKAQSLPMIDFYSISEGDTVKQSAVVLRRGIHFLRNEIAGLENSVTSTASSNEPAQSSPAADAASGTSTSYASNVSSAIESRRSDQPLPATTSVASSRSLNYLMFSEQIQKFKDHESDDADLWTKKLAELSVPPLSIFLTKKKEISQEEIDCEQLYNEAYGELRGNIEPEELEGKRARFLSSSKCLEYWYKKHAKPTPATGAQLSRFSIEQKLKSVENPKGTSAAAQAFVTIYDNVLANLDPEGIMGLLFACFQHKFGIPLTAEALCEYALTQLIELDPLGFKKALIAADPTLAAVLGLDPFGEARESLDENLQALNVEGGLEGAIDPVTGEPITLKNALELNEKFNGASIATAMVLRTDDFLFGPATFPVISDPRIILVIKSLERNNVPIELVPGSKNFSDDPGDLLTFGEWTWPEIEAERQRLYSEGYSEREAEAELVRKGYLVPSAEQYEPLLSDESVLDDVSNLINKFNRALATTGRSTAIRSSPGAEAAALGFDKASDFVAYLKKVTNLQALCQVLVKPIMELPGNLLKKNGNGLFDSSYWENWAKSVQKQVDPGNLFKFDLPDNLPTDQGLGDYGKQLLNAFLTMIGTVLGQILNTVLLDYLERCFEEEDPQSAGNPIDAGLGSELIPNLPSLTAPLATSISGPDILAAIRGLIDSFNSKSQLCSLLKGEASNKLLNKCVEYIRQSHGRVFDAGISTPEIIKSIFIDLGEGIDLEICNIIETAELALENDVCAKINYNAQARIDTLQAAGLSQAEAQEQHLKELQNLKKKIFDVAEFLFPGSNPLEGKLPQLCGPGGIYTVPPEIRRSMENVTDNILLNAKGSLLIDMSDLKFLSLPPRAALALADPSSMESLQSAFNVSEPYTDLCFAYVGPGTRLINPFYIDYDSAPNYQLCYNGMIHYNMISREPVNEPSLVDFKQNIVNTAALAVEAEKERLFSLPQTTLFDAATGEQIQVYSDNGESLQLSAGSQVIDSPEQIGKITVSFQESLANKIYGPGGGDILKNPDGDTPSMQIFDVFESGLSDFATEIYYETMGATGDINPKRITNLIIDGPPVFQAQFDSVDPFSGALKSTSFYRTYDLQGVTINIDDSNLTKIGDDVEYENINSPSVGTYAEEVRKICEGIVPFGQNSFINPQRIYTSRQFEPITVANLLKSLPGNVTWENSPAGFGFQKRDGSGDASIKDVFDSSRGLSKFAGKYEKKYQGLSRILAKTVAVSNPLDFAGDNIVEVAAARFERLEDVHVQCSEKINEELTKEIIDLGADDYVYNAQMLIDGNLKKFESNLGVVESPRSINPNPLFADVSRGNGIGLLATPSSPHVHVDFSSPGAFGGTGLGIGASDNVATFNLDKPWTKNFYKLTDTLRDINPSRNYWYGMLMMFTGLDFRPGLEDAFDLNGPNVNEQLEGQTFRSQIENTELDFGSMGPLAKTLHKFNLHDFNVGVDLDSDEENLFDIENDDLFTNYIKALEYYRGSPGLRYITDHPSYNDNVENNIIDAFMSMTLAEASGIQSERIKSIFPNLKQVADSLEGLFLTCVFQLNIVAMTSELNLPRSWTSRPSSGVIVCPAPSLVPLAVVFKRGFRNPDSAWNQDEQVALDIYSMEGDPVSPVLKKSLSNPNVFAQYMSFSNEAYYDFIFRKADPNNHSLATYKRAKDTPPTYLAFNPNGYRFEMPEKTITAAGISESETTSKLVDAFKSLSLATEGVGALNEDEISTLNNLTDQIGWKKTPQQLYYQHCRENYARLNEPLRNEYFHGIVQLNPSVNKSFPPAVVVDDTYYREDGDFYSDILGGSRHFSSVSKPLDDDLASILAEIYPEHTGENNNSLINKDILTSWSSVVDAILNDPIYLPGGQLDFLGFYEKLFQNIAKDSVAAGYVQSRYGRNLNDIISGGENYKAPDNLKAKIFGRFLTHKFKKELQKTNASFSSDTFLQKLEFNLASFNYSAMNFAYVNQVFSKLKNSRLNNRKILRKVWDVVLRTPNSPEIDPACQQAIDELNLTSSRSLQEAETDFFNIEEVKKTIMTLFDRSSCEDVFNSKPGENESATNSLLLGVTILIIKIYSLETCFASMLAWDSFKISDIFKSHVLKSYIVDNMRNDLGTDIYLRISSLARKTLAMIEETTEADIQQKYAGRSSLDVLIELEGEKISDSIEGIFVNNRPFTTQINLQTLASDQVDFVQRYNARYISETTASSDGAPLDGLFLSELAKQSPTKTKDYQSALPAYAYVLDAYFDNNIYTLNFSNPFKNMRKDIADVSHQLASDQSIFNSPKGTAAEDYSPTSLADFDPIIYETANELETLRDISDYYGHLTFAPEPLQKNYLHSLPLSTIYDENLGDLSTFSGNSNKSVRYYNTIDQIFNLDQAAEESSSHAGAKNKRRFVSKMSKTVRGSDPFDKENIQELTFGDEATLYLGNFIFQSFVYVKDQDDLSQFQAVTYKHPQTGEPCDASVGNAEITNATDILPIVDLEDYRNGNNQSKCVIRDYVPLNVWSDFYSNKFLPTIMAIPEAKTIFEQFGLRPFFSSVEIGIRMSYVAPNVDLPEKLEFTTQIGNMFDTNQKKANVEKNKSIIQNRNYQIADPENVQPPDSGDLVIPSIKFSDFICSEIHIPIVERKAKLVFADDHFTFDGDDTNRRPYFELGIHLPEKDIYSSLEGRSLQDLIANFDFSGQRAEPAQQYFASIANNFSQFFYKNVAKDAFNSLKNSAEFKLLFDYLLPMKDYMASAFLYSNNTISPFIEDSNIILQETKTSLRETFLMLTESNRYEYKPDPVASYLTDRLTAQDADTRGKGPNLEKRILRILLRTPLLILKGFVETTDTAIIIAKTIIDIANTIQLTVIGSIQAVLNGIKMATDGAIQQAETTITQATVQANIALANVKTAKQATVSVLQNAPEGQLDLTPEEIENIVVLDTEGKEKVSDWDIENNITPDLIEQNEDYADALSGLSDAVSALTEVKDTIGTLETEVDSLKEKKAKIEEEIEKVVTEAKKIMKDLFSSPYLLPSVWAALLPTITPVGLGGLIPPPLVIGPPSTIPGMIYLALLFIDDHEERMHALSQSTGATDQVDCSEEII